jgi:hypothetical protein
VGEPTGKAKKILGAGCSLAMSVAQGEALALVEMSGEKMKGRRVRAAKFDAAACRRLSKAFEEMAMLLEVAEVHST